MNIDSIENGIVIDHIKAGNAIRIYNYLRLDRLMSSVAIIQNCKSRKMGRKDIIKIDEEFEIDLDVLGYLEPGATVSFISDGKTTLKRKCEKPKVIRSVVKCNNPRCITTIEPGLMHEFRLTDGGGKYRCVYCDAGLG